MTRSFSYLLLITWFFLFGACARYVQTSVETRNLEVTDSLISLDDEVVEIYRPYKKILEKDMAQVIAVSREEMVKGKPESNLTNFLADLLLEEGRNELRQMGRDIEPDISYFNYGGIRTSIPEGEITVGKIFELMPFENEMVFLKLNGAQINEFLDVVAEKGGESVGGARFSISGSKAVDITINGDPLRPGAHYWLVTNDYVAAGGDGLEVFTQRSEFINSEKSIRDVIISHLGKKHENGEAILGETDGRITHE